MWVAVASDTVHLAAVAVWLGGLAMLVLFVLGRTTRDEAVPLVRRFSPIAFGAVLVIAGTGTYQSWREVGTLPALTGTEYGRLLVAKITLFVVLIGLGWLARRWIHRRTAATPASLRASVGAEVLIAVAVLALTAQLVATEPARETYATPLHTTIALEHGERLAVDVTPARVGTNTVRLVVRGADGQPMDVPELTAEISLEERDIGPLAVQLQRVAVGEYVAETASFPYAGRWELAITVRTTEFHQTTTTADLTVR